MKRLLLIPIAAVTLLVAGVAQAGLPGSKVGGASDSGFPYPSFSGKVNGATKLWFVVSTGQQASIDVDWSVSCSKRFDFQYKNGGFKTFGSVTRRIPVPIRNAKCSVTGSASFSDFLQEGSISIQIRAKK